MRRSLTGALLIVLSMVLSLDLATSFARICVVSLDACCESSHDTDCCDTDSPTCCFVIADETLFVADSKILGVFEAYVLAEIPTTEMTFLSMAAECFDEVIGNSPDPPPLSGRGLLSLIERQLI